MAKMCSVVVYGGSLSMMALEAALKASPGFRVTRLDPSQPDFLPALAALQPDVMIGNTAIINSPVPAHCLQLALQGETIVLIKHDTRYVMEGTATQQQLTLVRTAAELIGFLAKHTDCHP